MGERISLPTPQFCREPADFEKAAEAWFNAWGFTGVKNTPPGADGGVDVESSEAIAQVKAHMVPIGIEEVQRLSGASLHRRIPVFFSLMSYTEAAVLFADQAGIPLFRFSDYQGSIEIVNKAAKHFLAERERPIERYFCKDCGWSGTMSDLEFKWGFAEVSKHNYEPPCPDCQNSSISYYSDAHF